VHVWVHACVANSNSVAGGFFCRLEHLLVVRQLENNNNNWTALEELKDKDITILGTNEQYQISLSCLDEMVC